MRPAEVSNESIIEAGQALQAAGRNITGFALRQKVGGGNPTRLKQVWDEHINSQAVAQAEPVAELPHEVAEEVAGVTKALTERLASLAVELNDKAVKAAERRVAEVIRTAGEQREQAERELADAAATVEELETKLDTIEAEAGELETKLADSQAAHQAQAVELAQVRERLAQIEQAGRQAAELHAAEVQRLNAGIEAERKAHQEAQAQAGAELARSRQDAGQVRAELGTVRADLDQVRGELVAVKAKAQAAAESHQEHRKQAAAEAHRVAERMTKAETDRDTARKEAAQAREDAAKLRGQVEALQGQVGELTRALATVQAASKGASAEGQAVTPASTGTKAKRAPKAG